MPEIKERAFEDAIENVLVMGRMEGATGSAAAEPSTRFGEFVPGGFRRRTAKDYDRTLCLIPEEAIDFIVATQPKVWGRLKEHYGADVKARFLGRLADEVARRGTLDVLRTGIKDAGCKFKLAHFRPASELNLELRELYRANQFSVVRQLGYSEKSEHSIDLVLFLNGLPIFTAELKNPLNGQDVEDAIRQYERDRDPREPLLSYGRCLAHFAVDPNLVYVTTHLHKEATRFLPFNRGWDRGAGNLPISPTQSGYATSYLWETIWSRDSILDLVRQFIHEVEEFDEDGRKTGKRYLLFPRYHQLDAVRRLVIDARSRGAGQHYLIQHSAGSGKSFTIAWLAHQLSTLHDEKNRRVFDSIIVITDRRILDRQLQRTVLQFEQTLGVVENIDQTSRQLKDALQSGKTIIVTTLQKFPMIVKQVSELPGSRFAVIVDEAHSSQSGESTKDLKSVLAAGSLEDAEREEAEARSPEEELDDLVLAEMQVRGRLPNVSMFAFTATPKPKTLEIFGRKRPEDGKFEAFSLYSMRQAIDERFILDVLENYTTYQAYWKLLKTIADDPKYDRDKASYLMRQFVELHPHAIGEKVKIMVEHFATQVQDKIGGKAKAMLVTRSRLHAVRYKLAVDKYFKERGYPWKALVAFSGTVVDGGMSYTEPGMNSAGSEKRISEKQTAKEFARSECRFLIAANKFQTGFDQPLLHTMYVDKKLGGVNAVQTLSRLNRTLPPEKTETMVLDFANEAEAIQKAFEPYYETTILSEATDPNLLYEQEQRLKDFGVYTSAEVDAFAKAFYSPSTKQDRLYALLGGVVGRARELGLEERRQFRAQLVDYVRLYAFLSQILPFRDPDLGKLYHFARYLRKLVPVDAPGLPREVQENIDIDSYRIQRTSSGKISLETRNGRLHPMRSQISVASQVEDLEPLSAIIAELNERFGLNLGSEHRMTLEQMMDRLDQDKSLDASARVNTRENVRLTFDHKVDDVIQDIVDTNFELYKRISDNPTFGEALRSFLFDQYLRTHRHADELLKQHESKTLEFKSTLRWNLKEARKDAEHVTHSVLKTIAAFLNTDGGDLLIGVADDRTIVGIEADGFESEDKFLLHLSHVIGAALGDRSGACVDAKIETVGGKTICLVSCRRSPEPVLLKWKSDEEGGPDHFYVRSGPQSVELDAESRAKYIATRWGRGTEQGPVGTAGGD
jgi:type I restriction enzyme R subunit